jgi:hypothetical protein
MAGLAVTSALVFSLLVRPRLTGVFLQPDFAYDALVWGCFLGTGGRFERIFSARDDKAVVTEEQRPTRYYQNLSGMLTIAIYLSLELVFLREFLGISLG